MKARRVKGLDPAGTLGDNAERIVAVRLDELCSFMPRAADPVQVTALHDMRIAAKRLRYILEITGPGFGPYARTAVKVVKDLQDLLGDIHDCDVQLPEVRELARALAEEDAKVLLKRAGDAADLDPALVKRAPNRSAHAGLGALTTHLLARRELLFTRFLELWESYERKAFRSRLEFAITERSGASIPPA